MIRRRKHQLPRNNERGVTMLLVVVAMLSMLGVIALAIDVITLYSARSETQRAADAAAIAAAKMLVDMGVTPDPTPCLGPHHGHAPPHPLPELRARIEGPDRISPLRTDH